MDLMSVCRTCMSSTTLNPIFPLPEAHERFSKAIYLTTGVKVTIDDGLPQKMCLECLKQVNDAMKFRAKCKETEGTLIKIKYEVRRAERHNTYVTDKAEVIREIKVDNRWVKIDNTNHITPDDDEDEQPLVHLINAHSNNNIQNIYINEADGQLIPLEMLKVEMHASHDNGNNYEDTINEEDAGNEAEYSRKPQYLIYEQEHSNNDQKDTINYEEDTMNDQEDTLNEQEDTISGQDETINDQEDTMNEDEDTMNEREDTMNEHEDTVSNDGDNFDDHANTNIAQKDTTDEQKYIIPNAVANDNNQTKIVEPEYTITISNLKGNYNNQKKAIKSQRESDNDPENSNILETYYIMEDTVSDDDAEPNETKPDTAENPDFDNINISENQEIVVMDNKESLYVIDMSNPSSKRVTCKLCQKNLSIRSIDLHLSRSHPGADGRRVKCQLCDNFVVKEKMVQHRLVMHGAGAFQCRYCKSQFEKEESLIQHVQTCTVKKKRKACDSGKELMECGVCHKKMQKASLRLHTAIMHRGLRPVCDHCGKSFGNKFRLYEHCRARHGYEKFKCSSCGFESASSLALRNHERRHSGEKPFVCERCGAKFHAAYLLAQHSQSHRTERKYKCEVCSTCFKTNNGLHSHRRVCRDGARRLRPVHPAKHPPE